MFISSQGQVEQLLTVETRTLTWLLYKLEKNLLDSRINLQHYCLFILSLHLVPILYILMLEVKKGFFFWDLLLDVSTNLSLSFLSQVLLVVMDSSSQIQSSESKGKVHGRLNASWKISSGVQTVDPFPIYDAFVFIKGL